MSMEQARAALQRHWKHHDFRKAQRIVVELALDGNDVLAVLPTGGGKSVCFQIPAIVSEGGAIVVSPLIALMKDQVDDCTRRGIPATYINSHVDRDDQDERIADFIAGAYKLLYIAPERLNHPHFLQEIARADVSYIVVDEAHAHRPDSLIYCLDRFNARPSLRRADQVQVGDMVVGWDEEGDHALSEGGEDQLVVQRITGVCARESYRDVWVDIYFETGSTPVRVTSKHPIYVDDHGFMMASEVKVGDLLPRVLWDDLPFSKMGLGQPINAGGHVNYARVVEVDLIGPDDPRRDAELPIVYTISVTDTRTYFADGVLNHNCCSEWGHDFRPDYMRINRLVHALTKRGGTRPPILAMTATATNLVVQDVVTSLEMAPDHALVVGDPLRTNLDYQVEDATLSPSRAFQIAEDGIAGMDLSAGRHILYANTRKMAERLVEMAVDHHGKGRADFYHGGMKKEERERVQDGFKSGDVPIVCATTAFGMGIDVPNIRTVLNFGIPSSLEAYVQQCGRAGRDGLPSVSLVIVDDYSIRFQRTLIEGSNPPAALYGVVWDYLHDQLQPDTTLRKTVREMTGEIISLTRKVIQEQQVSVILGILHSKGLIDKRPVEAGTPITFDVRAFEATLRTATPKPFVRRVWEELWTHSVRPELDKPGMATERAVTAYVNKNALQAAAEVASSSTVSKAIESLENRGISRIGDTYTGNIIGIRQWRADLTIELPFGKIDEKRASDFARFNAMLAYARLRDAGSRAAFLRDYFLKPAQVS